MTPIAVRPTRADLSVAEIISTHTGPRTERAAEFLTWGADEHILCALAAGWWAAMRGGHHRDTSVPARFVFGGRGRTPAA